VLWRIVEPVAPLNMLETDIAAHGIEEGDFVRISSDVAELEVPARIIASVVRGARLAAEHAKA
jgi:anaerobic selenocysteine-containing dehydrogenase